MITFLIDSGHGAMLNNAYQTAPDKMYKFPDGKVAYEGVINRQVKDLVLKHGVASGLRMIDISPSVLDIGLQQRVSFANSLSTAYGAKNCLLISIHSNAGKGTGFEIFTTRGENVSDKYATLFVQMFEKSLGNMTVRKDLADDDPDKEAEFYIQKNTVCPSILLEWGFFDNENDYKIISSEFEQMRYAKLIIDFCHKVNSL